VGGVEDSKSSSFAKRGYFFTLKCCFCRHGTAGGWQKESTRDRSRYQLTKKAEINSLRNQAQSTKIFQQSPGIEPQKNWDGGAFDLVHATVTYCTCTLQPLIFCLKHYGHVYTTITGHLLIG
jgi:hypothetical protein